MIFYSDLHLGLLLLLFVSLSKQAPPPECYDAPAPSPSRALPLCGNGVLDAGEVCDDGNKINFDGCNAFCSAFDALVAANTIAGGPVTCPDGKNTVLGGTTSQVQFCNLRAIDTALDGSYVILADGSKLLRFDLFTDATKGSIRQLDASIDHAFSDSICSVAVLKPDSAIVIHDCGAQKLFIAMGNDDGSHIQMLADWSDFFASNNNNKAYYDKNKRIAVVAGKLQSSAFFSVQMVNISLFDNFFVQNQAPVSLATIPRVVYNVWEGVTKRASMDIGQMEARAVVYEPCPDTFRSMQMCFCVYMESPINMEFFRIYVPENGGVDLEFYSYTTNLMDNALGHPLIRHSGSLVYTLSGSCFQVESRILTDDGKTPPVITLGNACKQRSSGSKCNLPFNNPFITDVITTPILLPDGLSASHTHMELSQIFAATCGSDGNNNNASLGVVETQGPRLYQSVLRSVYASTLPVDFVELAGILDIVYVTPTSVGLISTKRTILYDRNQPGYVRPTNLIHCPSKQYGTVGGVCIPCEKPPLPSSFSSMVPVSYQIQCRGGEFETFTIVASKNVSSNDVHQGICTYGAAKNGSCASDVSLAFAQPFNMAADALEANNNYNKEENLPLTSSRLDDTKKQTSNHNNNNSSNRIRCLIAEAERITGNVLFRTNGAEYNSRVVSQGRHILDATTSAVMLPLNGNYSTEDDAKTAQVCRGTLVKGISVFLQCAMKKKMSSVVSGSRRLLQANNNIITTPLLIEHQGLAYASSNAISWNLAFDPSAVPHLADDNKNNRRIGDDAGQSSVPLWVLVLVITLACAIVLSVFAYMMFHHAHNKIMVMPPPPPLRRPRERSD